MTVSVKVMGSLGEPATLNVYPYGPAFFKYQCMRYDMVNEVAEEDSGSDSEDLSDADIELDLKYIKSLESKDWKDQDHYRVLGLPNLRVESSVKDIKKAYKFMVLKCHPDKASQGNTKVDEEAFTCIQKAYEQLCTVEGKRAYDSIDPEFDDDTPNITEHNKQNFYDIFGKVMDTNAQWSMQKNVPKLGTESDSIDKVNDFYNFWYDFKSWREYSYLDEEEREKAECKEERRYIDKLNKQERLRRKKEEMTRMHELVNRCYACDPRIKAFNEERKRRKVEAKLAKQEAYKKELEAAKLQKEENERIAKEQEAQRVQEAKEKAEIEKKERQKQNKLLKQERKKLRENVKSHNYFNTNEDNIVKSMENLDLLLLSLTIDDMKNLNSVSEDTENFTILYQNQLNSNLAAQENKTKENLMKAKQSQDVHKEQTSNADKFTTPDIALLVKAVKSFPPGTVNRWNTIADYMNLHSALCKTYESKDIITKVKKLQSKEGDDLKTKINKQAYENFEKSQKQRIDEVVHTGGLSSRDTVNTCLAPDLGAPDEVKKRKQAAAWGADEQKLLEEALKKFPQAALGSARWESIAEHVGTKTKKECMRRYKELVEQIKAKKAKA